MAICYRIVVLLIFVGSLFCSCEQNNKDTTNYLQKKKNNMESINSSSEYQDLIDSLQQESLDHIPMLRSSIYPKVIELGRIVLPDLIASVQDSSYKHYLCLMAISNIDSDSLRKISEEIRLKIWIDALKKNGQNNDWGLAGRYLSGGSLDMVEIGKEAIPHLFPLLKDKSPTGIWGSKEATINRLYENRLCDFAYYVILKILDKEEEYPQTQVERDVLIEELSRALIERRFVNE